MLAAGPGRAMTHDVVMSCEGDPILGVCEQFQVVSQLGQHLLRIRVQAP